MIIPAWRAGRFTFTAKLRNSYARFISAPFREREQTAATMIEFAMHLCEFHGADARGN